MNIQHGLNLNQSFSKTRNADLQELIQIFEGINKILIASSIDRIVHEWLCKNYKLTSEKDTVLKLKKTQALWDIARQMVRCIIVRYYFQFSYRDCAIRLADGHLFQTFCQLKRRRDKDSPGNSILIAPSKSQLQRWETMLPADVINAITTCITRMASDKANEAEHQTFGLNEPIRLEDIYLDTTCLEANIHYPVDWKLLLDAVITLMKGTIRIRKAGLINRMQPPQLFIKKMNQLAIKMYNVSRSKEWKTKRKKTFREMKSLLMTVVQHAQKHRELLKNQWQTTTLREGEKDQIVFGLDNILNQVKDIVSQAESRIVKGEQVESHLKVLSLYDRDIHVIKRKKSGSEVEFGNKLAITEQSDGLIIDWHLCRDGVPADNSDVLPKVLDRLKTNYPKTKKYNLTTDRGFDCQRNRDLLKKEEIANFMCPRNVSKLQERMSDFEFAEHQKRRAQTEARIGIVKNVFLNLAVRAKEFENREKAVAWGILTHNLWVIARLARQQRMALRKIA